MTTEKEKLLESKNVIQMLANGINPLDHSSIEENSILHNPQIIRPLFYLLNYISNEIENKSKPMKKPTQFLITDEQKSEIKLPPGKIGVSDFARAVNAVINPFQSKKLNGMNINKKLKLLGILSETIDEEGKRRTTTNENSEGYGIETVTKSYNGRESQQVVFNNEGKEFLLKNIEHIMNYKDKPLSLSAETQATQ